MEVVLAWEGEAGAVSRGLRGDDLQADEAWGGSFGRISGVCDTPTIRRNGARSRDRSGGRSDA